MEPGFVAHAREVEQVLVDPRTTFVVVSTLEAAPTHEASYLARALRDRDMSLGAIVANRVLPAGITSKASAASARKLATLDDQTVERVAAALDADPAVVGDVLRDVAAQFHDTAMVATRESERRSELSALAPLLVSIPLLDGDANDIADLLEIAEHFDS
jgi:anion-transporting  ArsA/GET3 family ATPase